MDSILGIETRSNYRLRFEVTGYILILVKYFTCLDPHCAAELSVLVSSVHICLLLLVIIN